MGRRVVHVYVWGSYVVVDLGDGFHLFYKPSFIGYEKEFPYRRKGVVLLVVGSLMMFIAWTLGEASRSIDTLLWLGPMASFLLVFGVLLLIIGLVLMFISRRVLRMESHGGLCYDYTNTPTITKNHLKALTEKLEKIGKETHEPI